MPDIRIVPGNAIMSFTSSLNYIERITQDPSGSLNLYGSGSTGRTDLLSIDGNNGRLFTVSDDLSDSLFSVNTIAGLPVIEAFADNRVNIGQYGAEAIKVSGSRAFITGSLFGTASYATFAQTPTVTGATGVIGVSGATGPIGVTGATGPIGVSGATGVVGVSGATGVIGVSGATGVIGVSGATGVVGVSGATGVIGVSGATGVVGVSGATGVIGVSGATGTVGVTGATGPAAGSANQVVYKNSSNVAAGSSNLTFDGTTLFGTQFSAPALSAGSSGNLNTDFNNTPANTFRYQGDQASLTNSPGNTWWFYQNMRHSNASNYWGTQVAWGWEDNANKLATRNITGGSFGSWVYYLNSANYNSYAPTLTGTGASGNWGINITGNAGTATTAGVIAYSPNRTDGTAYPVLWGAGSTTTQAYSAAAVTIQSSTGTLNATTLAATTQITAPIFYETGTTSYYVDPASTSRLFQLEVYEKVRAGNGYAGEPTFTFTGDTNTGMYNISADVLGFSTAGTARMAIHDNGKVSVNNTDNTLGQFSVNNNASVTSYNTTFRMLEGATFKNDTILGWNVAGQYSFFGNYQNFPLILRTNDQNRVWITAGGAMGLGITPTNTAGRFEASNDIVAYSTSDKRWKNNIVKIDSPLEKISQISGVEFDWIEDEPFHGNKGHDVGVIAQEIELVIPEAVQTRESGMKAVQYDKIIPLLIEAIKELQKEIKELKK
jgi:hypothetical protein